MSKRPYEERGYPEKYPKYEDRGRRDDYKRHEDRRQDRSQDSFSVRSNNNSSWNKREGLVDIYTNSFNFLKSKDGQKIEVFSYHVESTSDSIAFFHKEIKTKFKDLVYAYDNGSYLWTAGFDILKDQEKLEFKNDNNLVTIKRIDGSNMKWELIYNNVMKESLHALSRGNRVDKTVTRKFIRVQNVLYDLSQKKDIGKFPAYLIKGFKGAVHENNFVCNIVYRSFPKDTVLNSLRDRSISTKKTSFYIMPFYNQRMIKIDGFDETKSIDYEFNRNGRMIKLVDYYKENYNLTVKDYHQPLMYRNTPKGKEYYIPELCTLISMPEKIKNDFGFKKEWKFGTSLSPQQRFKEIEEFMEMLKTHKGVSTTLQKWSVDISSKMSKIEGKLFAPPVLEFGNREKVQSVQFDIRNQKIYQAPSFNTNQRYICIEPCDIDPKRSDSIFKMIEDNAKTLGFDFGHELKVKILNCKTRGERGYTDVIERAIELYPGEIAFFLILLDNKSYYKDIKRTLAKHGKPSQVVLLSTFEKQGLSKCTKLNIQQVGKYGGTPWKVTNPLDGLTNACFLGIDFLKKSVSVVSSLGQSSTYFSKVGTDYELPTFVDQAMETFKNENKNYPDIVVFYRLGDDPSKISNEVKELERVLQSKYLNEKKDVPLFAYLLTNKAPHNRFWNTQKGNVDAGTIASDSNEFYLISVDNFKSTSIPTKFQIIKNNIEKISMDQIQNATYSLCYGYYNWFGSVKVPNVCQYASRLVKFYEDNLNGIKVNKDLDRTLYYI